MLTSGTFLHLPGRVWDFTCVTFFKLCISSGGKCIPLIAGTQFPIILMTPLTPWLWVQMILFPPPPPPQSHSIEWSHLRMGHPSSPSQLNFPNSWSLYNLPHPLILPTYLLLFIPFFALMCDHDLGYWCPWRTGLSKLLPKGQIWPFTYFGNRVVLEPSHTYLFVYCLGLLSCYSCGVEQLQRRPHVACKT